MRVLLVEDDALVGDAVEYRLRRERFAVDWVRDGETALAAARSGGFDLVVLDLGVPELDGFDVLAGMRAADIATPVLVLTARDALDDRVKGLDLGADDYLVKPFEMPEFLARCRALVRRGQGNAANTLSAGELTIDLKSHTVELKGDRITLPLLEYRILVLLLQRRGQVVPKPQIEEMLYGWSSGAESNTVEVYVSQLRRKIGAERIRTLRGIGYMIP